MENMGTALAHTVIGMGTVFIILIFISLIISLFKYISVIQNKLDAKKNPAPAVPAVVEPVVEEIEEETDDLALIAVITAAVAASMGTTSTDGFVVRSIRRKSGNRW